MTVKDGGTDCVASGVRSRSREEERPPDPWAFGRALGAELVGTFALTLVAAGGEVIAGIGGTVDATARAVAPGLTVLAMIYALGQVSGAHINPAVTLAFALRGVFPWRHVPTYWLSQLAGAVLAASLLRVLYGAAALARGATVPKIVPGAALPMEIVLTFLLVSVILGTATRERLIGPNAAIAVGSTVALCGLFAAPISGASMNPARSLGPALIGQVWHDQWIYVVGPALGATIAVLFAWILHGSPQSPEATAAQGDEQERH